MMLAVALAVLAGLALEGPEVYKLDWNTRSVQATDVDGDGRRDLVVINNSRARIDVLYQRKPGETRRVETRAARRRWEPVLEDARFRKEGVVSGIQAYALAVGDLDGDGLTDLAYTGNPDGLTVRFQGPAGTWDRRRVFESEQPNQWRSSLKMRDLDGDGTTELLMLAENDLLIFRTGAAGEIESPARYPLADPGCYGLLVADLDDDGRLDVAYVAPSDSHAWRVRFQHETGLGPERAFPVQQLRRGLTPLRLDGRTALAGVQERTGLIEFLALEPDRDPSSPSLSPRVYSTPTEENTAGSFAAGDFDGDGGEDLAVADRKGARVWLYFRTGDGSFGRPVAFPSFSDLRSLSAGDADRDGTAELYAVSRDERLLGASRMTQQGRLGYPTPLPLEGRPLAATTLEVGDRRELALACLVADDDGRNLVLLRSTSDDGFRESLRLPLEGLRTDPEGIAAMDVDRDGLSDLVVFVPRSPARILLQTGDGFDDVSAAETFRRGLLDGLQAAGLTAGGAEPMIVAGRGYARSLAVDDTGALVVLDQFNSLDRDAEIAAAIPVDLRRDGNVEMLLVHQGGQRIESLERDRKGVFRHARTFPVGRIEVVDTSASDSELLLLGTDRFWAIPLEGADLEPRSLGLHESEPAGMEVAELGFADFDGDGEPEMIALDTRETHLLQLLVRKDGNWSSRLEFTVFDADPHYEGRRGASNEPREMLVTDVTGDGRPDVVLLVHDRLLVYAGRLNP